MRSFFYLALLTAGCVWGASGCRHMPGPAPIPAEKAGAAPTNAALPAVTHETPPVTTATAATNTVDASDEEAYRQILLLTKTMMLIRKNYVDDKKVSYKDLIHSALDGMVDSLDPYSQFMEPTSFQELRDDTSGEFGGIGINVGVKDGLLSVIAPMEDTPAFRAGLLAGDKIIAIDGEKTDGLPMRDAVKKLRGAKGTDVQIKILRNRDIKDFTLTRELIKVASVKGTRIMEDGIGYVRITQFSEPTPEMLQNALDKLFKQGLRALVLDLRNNPGGLLPTAIAVSEKFLKPNDLIVFTKGRGGRLTQPPAKAGGRVHYTDFPMAILVNGGSASASEIVSGALQDHKRAFLVGEVTFGKGSVQTVIRDDDGTALRLTTAKYYTPSERVIHDKGIEPDIAVPVSAEEWQRVVEKRNVIESPALYADREKPADFDQIVDRQLERAMDALKGILIFQSRD
jgi:carboxyl-terminal processing protease